MTAPGVSRGDRRRLASEEPALISDRLSRPLDYGAASIGRPTDVQIPAVKSASPWPSDPLSSPLAGIAEPDLRYEDAHEPLADWRTYPATSFDSTQRHTSHRSPHQTSTRAAPTHETSMTNYTGLGLGLPFSATTSSGLDSFAVAHSAGRATLPSSPMTTTRAHRPAADASASGISEPSSPEIDRDRSKLIGLGELATPRWTAAVYERRWGQHPVPEVHSDWESDVLGGYSGDTSRVSAPSSSPIMHVAELIRHTQYAAAESPIGTRTVASQQLRPARQRDASIASLRSPALGSEQSQSDSSAISAIDQLLSVLSADDLIGDNLSSSLSYGSAEAPMTARPLPQVPTSAMQTSPSVGSSPKETKGRSTSSRKTMPPPLDVSLASADPSPRRRTMSAETRARRRSSLLAAARRSSPIPPHAPSPPPPLPTSSSFVHHRSYGQTLSGTGSPQERETSRSFEGVSNTHSPQLLQKDTQTSPMLPPTGSAATRKRSIASEGPSRRTSQANAHPASSDGVSTLPMSTATGFSPTGALPGTSSNTSISAFAPGVNNSSLRAARSVSAGSDASSPIVPFSSSGEDLVSRGNESPIKEDHVPPVPPLPKGWESYRPSIMTQSANELLPVNSIAGDDVASPTSSPRLGVDNADTVAPTGKAIRNKKWSISSAFGLNKASANAMRGSDSFDDLVFPSEQAASTEPTPFGKRKSISSYDIAGSANTGRRRGSLVPSVEVRSRPASSNSNNANLRMSDMQPPSGMTASTSRSSISSRKTPSGIPFFSRKSSSASADEEMLASSILTPDGGIDEKEKGGRKSLLGITFQRRKSTAAAAPETVAPSAQHTALLRTTATPQGPERFRPVETNAAERSSEKAVKASQLANRRRGKTLPSSGESPIRASPQMPPAQVHALSSETSRKIEALASAMTSTSTSSRDDNRFTAGSSVRLSRLEPAASIKSNLPTIAGSPSVAASSTRDAEEVAKPHTPTRIPRAVPSGTTSPAQLMQMASPSDRPSPASYTGPRRHVGGTTSSSSQPSSSPETPLSPALALKVVDAGDPAAPSQKRAISSTSTATAGARSKSSASASAASSQAMPRTAEQSALPRSTRRASLLATSRTSTKASESAAEVNEHGALKVKRLSNSSLRTPSKQNTKAQSSPSTTSTAVQHVQSSNKGNAKPAEGKAQRRLSAQMPEVLQTSRSTAVNLANKLALPSRHGKSAAQARLTPAESDSSRSTPSTQRATPISEEESRADEEMASYARRQQAKKLAAGASREELQRMFEFPGAIDPSSYLTANDARSLYGRSLCEYERDEILGYERVWYFGQYSAKKMATPSNILNNYGYDDDRGDYIIVDKDHICFRYEITGLLGKGSFGQVIQCRDHATGEMVAIKIIRNKKRFHHQALIEIKVLENLRKWDPDEKHHVIKMTDHFSFRGHLCIVTELLSINLYELIKANSFAGFSTVLIRRFTAQILDCLVLLRHHRVVHCDLKPENVLLRHPTRSGVQVIDFGSSCFEHEKVYTYIQSRFYRSPEVILGMNYHMAIDMWSLGCILAELYTGVPLFPGENEQEQLACIMECLGVPDKYLIDRSSRKKLFFDSSGQPRPVVNSKGKRRRPGAKTLTQVLKCDDEMFIDFISKCLIYDPDRRLKAQAALRHPFCRRGTRTSSAVNATMPVSPRGPRLSLTNGSSLITAGAIATPKRKAPIAAGHTAPTSSSLYSSLGPPTASSTRARQARSAVVVPQTISRSALPV